jgi:hypothetical protein
MNGFTLNSISLAQLSHFHWAAAMNTGGGGRYQHKKSAAFE